MKTIYPWGNSPQLVMSDEPYAFSLTLSHQETKLESGGLKDFIEALQSSLGRFGPGVSTLENEIIETGDGKVARLSLSSQAVDTAIYNMLFVTSVNRQVLMGSIHFPYEKCGRMVPLAQEIIGSLKRLKMEADKS